MLETSPPNVESLSGISDELQVVQDLMACDAALQELRSFRVTEATLKFVRQHAQLNPRASCASIYLAARMLYNEQIKAYLDIALENEAEEVIQKYEGTPEAEQVRHAINALSDYSEEKELQSAAEYFNQALETPRADQKFPHLRLLGVIAQQRLAEKRAVARVEDYMKNQEALREVAENQHSSVVLRRWSARYGVQPRKSTR